MQSTNVDAKFIYNESGLRVQKIVNGVVTDYVLHGKNVVHMTKGDDELHFFYDAQNRPAVVVYNGVSYAYVKSLQGDVIAILDAAGNVVVSYAYDAWGAPIGKSGMLAETLGKVQPFRYRGYVFDEETGLYYLRSRYYSAERCRFVNCDTLIGGNLYCYCLNVPVSRYDLSGCESSTTAEYPDYTNQIDSKLELSVHDFVDHSVSSNLYPIPTLHELIKDKDSYLWFIGQVTHHAKWDLKDDDSWVKMFSDLPATNELFLYRGELIDREALGNITYGYLGTAMGCSPEMLYIGGGIAKYVTVFSMAELEVALKEVLKDPELYGDDQNDHNNIKKGIEYYWDDYPKGAE